MAAVTTIALAGMAVAGAAKAYSGARQAKQAKKSINSYQRQELVNPYEDMRISTLGSDLLREENARTSASMIDAIRDGGSRAIIGASNNVQRQNNLVNQEAAINLDNQMLQRERAIAQGDMQIQGMYERREEGDLAGLGQKMNVGQQNMWSGIGDVASAGMYAANTSGTNLDGYGGYTPQVSSANNLTTAGLMPMQTAMPTVNPNPNIGYLRYQ